MPQRNVYHIVPHDGQWAVRLEGSDEISSVANTRGEALDEASSFLHQLGDGRVVVHDADGRIEAGYALGSIPTRRDNAVLAWTAGVLGVAFVIGLFVAVQRQGD